MARAFLYHAEDEDVCTKCGRVYSIPDVSKNFGSNDKHTCWGCLREWMTEAANNPFKVGAGLMRNEPAHHISDDMAKAYKQAFEATESMLKERPLTTDEIFEITTAKIGHCNDIDQLEFLVRFTQARLDAMRKRKPDKR